MEFLVETDNISLDYSYDREVPYRVTIYDKYGHFDGEFFLTEEQIQDLSVGINNIKK